VSHEIGLLAEKSCGYKPAFKTATMAGPNKVKSAAGQMGARILEARIALA
jgi:hypothetical protein